MGNILYLFFIGLICISQDTKPPVQNDWQDLGLKGKVKSLTINVDWNVGMGDASIKTNLLFDSVGYLIEKKMVSTYGKGKTFSKSFSFSYDSLSRKVEEREFKNGSLKRSIKFVYNDSSDIVFKRHYSSKGELRSAYSYQYDYETNSKEEFVQYNDEPIRKKQTWIYKENGLLRKQLFFNLDESQNGMQTFYYDTLNRLLETIEFKSNGDYGDRIVYKYDSKGNEVQVKHYADFYKSITKEVNYEYNQQNNVIKQSLVQLLDNINEEYRNEYEYDEYGNYLKLLKYRDKQLIGSETRWISYFD